MEISVMSRINNTTLAKRKIYDLNSEISNGEIEIILDKLIAKCDKNIKEIEDNKKSLNESMSLNMTMVNQSCYYVADIKVIYNK
jgi:hypothetical protein